jgi:hypothetical protein
LAYCVIGTAKTNQTITVTADNNIATGNGRGTAIVFRGSFPANPVDKYVATSAATNASVTSGALAQAIEAVVVVTHSDGTGRSFVEDSTDGFTELDDDSGGTHVQYKITAATTSLVVGTDIVADDYHSCTLGSYKNQ